MSKCATNSAYERAKWFLQRRGLDRYAEVPELLLAMVEYGKEMKGHPRKLKGNLAIYKEKGDAAAR